MLTIKKIFNALLPIILSYIGSYIFIIITSIVYTLFDYSNLDNFINNIIPWVLLIFYILIIIYLKNKYYRKEQRIKYYFPKIYLGISMATFLNMIIFRFDLIPKETATISLPLALISSGIIGPILEEFLFRYIFYNKTKEFLSINKAILLTNLIFALIHLNPIKIIYAFILGLILNISYEKEQNILSPILIHIAANTIVLFLHEYNTYILFLSIINILLSIKLNFLKET